MLIVITGLFALLVLLCAAAVLHEAGDLVGHLRRSRPPTMRPPSFVDAYRTQAYRTQAYRTHDRAPRWREVVDRAAERRRAVILLAAQDERPPSRSHRELARYPSPASA